MTARQGLWFVSPIPDSDTRRIGGAARHSPKHEFYGCLLLVWNKMPVAFDHFSGLMTDPSVYYSLIDPRRSCVRAERVPQTVPATQMLPFGIFECQLESAMHLPWTER
jgi:hypothetical protein